MKIGQAQIYIDDYPARTEGIGGTSIYITPDAIDIVIWNIKETLLSTFSWEEFYKLSKTEQEDGGDYSITINYKEIANRQEVIATNALG